jgi:hypothetical protein
VVGLKVHFISVTAECPLLFVIEDC